MYSTFAWYQVATTAGLQQATGTFTDITATKPDNVKIDVGNIPVTISFVEVDYTGKLSTEDNYVPVKPLFPYEYGKLKTVTATGTQTFKKYGADGYDSFIAGNGETVVEGWHYAVESSNGDVAYDGVRTSGLTISNYQPYKVYKVIATIDDADVSADQAAGYSQMHCTLTFSANPTYSTIWANTSAPGDLASHGTGLTLNLTFASISSTQDTVANPGFVMLYANSAVTGTTTTIGFSVSAGDWSAGAGA